MSEFVNRTKKRTSEIHFDLTALTERLRRTSRKMEKKLEIKDTQFRTVPDEEGQADNNRKDTSLVDEGPQADAPAERMQ
jgi:hypothetical protein